MKRTNSAFWDSSALVQLCHDQVATPTAQKLARQYRKLVVWWGASVEIRSALARLTRNHGLSETDFKRALQKLNTMRASWSEIESDEDLRAIAEELPDKYGLRAMDAMQLAAVLVWCDEKPRKRPFICFDARLTEAAEKAGFTIYPK